MTRTVRDVLEAFVDHVLEAADAPHHAVGDRPEVVDRGLAELADVLTTGGVWKTRPVEAAELEPGDVIEAKDGRLHMVTAVRGNGREVTVSTRRGDHGADLTFPLTKAIPTLLTTTDARALALLEAELGATLLERTVA